MAVPLSGLSFGSASSAFSSFRAQREVASPPLSRASTDTSQLEAFDSALVEGTDGLTLLQQFVCTLLPYEGALDFRGSGLLDFFEFSAMASTLNRHQLRQMCRILSELEHNQGFIGLLSKELSLHADAEAWVRKDMDVSSDKPLSNLAIQRAQLLALMWVPGQYSKEANCAAISTLTILLDQEPQVALETLQSFLEQGVFLYGEKQIPIHQLMEIRKAVHPRPVLQEMMITAFEFVGGNSYSSIRKKFSMSLSRTLLGVISKVQDTSGKRLSLAGCSQMISALLDSVRVYVANETPGNHPKPFLYDSAKLCAFSSFADLSDHVAKKMCSLADIGRSSFSVVRASLYAEFSSLDGISDKKGGSTQGIFNWLSTCYGARQRAPVELEVNSPATFFEEVSAVMGDYPFETLAITCGKSRRHAFVITKERVEHESGVVFGSMNFIREAVRQPIQDLLYNPETQELVIDRGASGLHIMSRTFPHKVRVFL